MLLHLLHLELSAGAGSTQRERGGSPRRESNGRRSPRSLTSSSPRVTTSLTPVAALLPSDPLPSSVLPPSGSRVKREQDGGEVPEEEDDEPPLHPGQISSCSGHDVALWYDAGKGRHLSNARKAMGGQAMMVFPLSLFSAAH